MTQFDFGEVMRSRPGEAPRSHHYIIILVIVVVIAAVVSFLFIYGRDIKSINTGGNANVNSNEQPPALPSDSGFNAPSSPSAGSDAPPPLPNFP